ncbi:MAG: hypothetical protein AABW65_02185 [Nanoarchaeota archaeon]
MENLENIALTTAETSSKTSLELINEVIARGITFRKEIAQCSGLNPTHVNSIIKKYNLLPKKRMQTISTLKALHAEGLTLQQAANKLNRLPMSLRTIIRNYHLQDFLSEQLSPTRENMRIARHREDKEHRELYKMIRRGASLTQIGASFGFTREWARQFINDASLHHIWRKSRKSYEQHTEAKELARNRNKIFSLFQTHILKQLNSENISWPEKKTVEYILNYKYNKGINTSPERIKVLFKAYHEAQQKGERLSFEKLGKKAGISAPSAQRLLEKIGCLSIYKKLEYKPRKHLTPEQINRMQEASRLPMVLEDLAYFSGRSAYPFLVYGKKREQHLNSINWFSYNKLRLTYRIASQIYEAEDAGFSQQEMQELFEVPHHHVAHALEHRSKIAPIIMKALRLLHPEKHYTKPYLYQQKSS